MMKFRYEVVGEQRYRTEHRWVFFNSADAMAFAQTLLDSHKTEDEEENGPFEVSIEIHEDEDEK